MKLPEPSLLERTLAGRLALRGQRDGERPALRHKRRGIWEEISWRVYAERVAAMARALADLGVGVGDRVAILSDNRPEWLYTDLGAQSLGAQSVGVYQTSPADDLAYIANHSSAKVLVCEDQEQVDKFMQVADACPSLSHVLVIEPRGTRGYDEPRLRPFQDALVAGAERLAAEPDFWGERLAALDPAAPAMVVYTSGTTGAPKGAMLSAANVIDMLPGVVEALQVGNGEHAVLSYLPLCHVAEKVFTVFLPLATNTVVHFGESIETVQEDLREVSPTIFLGVPRIWEKMYAGVQLRMNNSSPLKRWLFERFTALGVRLAEARHMGPLSLGQKLQWLLGDVLVYRPLLERLGLRRCQRAYTGAAPIAPDLLRAYGGLGITVREGFGMTETAGICHVTRVGDERLGSVGTPVRPIQQRIAEDGEILVRGPGVFLGYLDNDEATRAVLDGDGWLHTGDIGEIDDAGHMRITGRKKEIIITAGGKNLSPERIENALKTSPFIKEVIATGDRRKFVAALVQIEFETVGEWAQAAGLVYTSFGDLVERPEVCKLIHTEVERANACLAQVEQVRRFELLPQELSQDDGELTATQKVRRATVAERYAALIERMYGADGGAA